MSSSAGRKRPAASSQGRSVRARTTSDDPDYLGEEAPQDRQAGLIAPGAGRASWRAGQ